jgi:hypothetical protein
VHAVDPPCPNDHHEVTSTKDIWNTTDEATQRLLENPAAVTRGLQAGAAVPARDMAASLNELGYLTNWCEDISYARFYNLAFRIFGFNAFSTMLKQLRASAPFLHSSRTKDTPICPQNSDDWADAIVAMEKVKNDRSRCEGLLHHRLSEIWTLAEAWVYAAIGTEQENPPGSSEEQKRD